MILDIKPYCQVFTFQFLLSYTQFLKRTSLARSSTIPRLAWSSANNLPCPSKSIKSSETWVFNCAFLLVLIAFLRGSLRPATLLLADDNTGFCILLNGDSCGCFLFCCCCFVCCCCWGLLLLMSSWRRSSGRSAMSTFSFCCCCRWCCGGACCFSATVYWRLTVVELRSCSVLVCSSTILWWLATASSHCCLNCWFLLRAASRLSVVASKLCSTFLLLVGAGADLGSGGGRVADSENLFVFRDGFEFCNSELWLWGKEEKGEEEEAAEEEGENEGEGFREGGARFEKEEGDGARVSWKKGVKVSSFSMFPILIEKDCGLALADIVMNIKGHRHSRHSLFVRIFKNLL